MWKVPVVQPVTEGFGFNITTEANVPLISFAYKTRAEAEAAATHAQDGNLGEDGGPSCWIIGTDETWLERL
jgi:hypothetical protein